MRTFKTNFIITTLSLIAVVATLGIPHEVNSKEEMQALELGFPVPFLVQNVGDYDPPSFPRKYALTAPLENPVVSFSLAKFAVSLGIMFLALRSLYYLIESTNSVSPGI